MARMVRHLTKIPVERTLALEMSRMSDLKMLRFCCFFTFVLNSWARKADMVNRRGRDGVGQQRIILFSLISVFEYGKEGFTSVVIDRHTKSNKCAKSNMIGPVFF